MKKTLLIVSNFLFLVIAVLASLPAFAENAQGLLYLAIAVALLGCVLALTLQQTAVAEPVTVPEAAPAPVAPETPRPDLQKIPEQNAEVQVAQLLGLLQEKGRFLDFVMDDIKSYPDAQIAAAARFVHQGCQTVMKHNFNIEPVATTAENQPITLEPTFDRNEYRLTGKVEGEPPYQGVLKHKGWKTTSVHLPKVLGERARASGTHLLVAAEVEVG
ncbi:DUF2760 domain-containing protein [Coraliomargarita sp. SDUM461004]|uniref:DUF2760 domain-containing protein n=1 Tax=Thalassobacterium sedimentorum TaxID=3041258 RepID=A0ABU1AH27_9BACT|nr:DUF2760 domain-containing protein [Coraliomargarita sp. SDUM461004]MDQ8193909.1 DUF2760 domain-containing protein [Coraliomargarita sp. SDUM461004]